MIKNRNLLIAPVLLGLTLSLAACAQQTPSTSADDELMGVWEMTTLEGGTADSFESIPYSGQIVFSPSTVSVQAMNPDMAAPDTPYTVRGYEAFYGDLTVDSASGTWSVQVESAAARQLIGQTLTRNYEVHEDTLVLTPIDPAEGWRVTYARVSE